MTQTPGWATPGGEGGPRGGPDAPHDQPDPQQPVYPPPGAPQHDPWGQLPGYPVATAEVRPGIVPLRPLGLGEIYDGAFQAVRSNPAAMIGAAAVVVTLMTAVQIVLQAWMTGSLAGLLESASAAPDQVPDTNAIVDALGATGLGALASGAVSAIALSVLTAIVIVVVGTAVLGRRTEGGELWRRVRARLLPLIGVTLLVGLITGAAVLVCLAPGLAALVFSGVAGVLLLLLGGLAAVVLYVWLDTRLVMAGPALVLEEQPVLRSIARSWRLTSRGLWRLIGIRALTVVIVVVTTAIVSAPFSIASMALFPGDVADPFASLTPTVPALVLQGIGSAIAATIVYPFAAAVTALLYVDQRMRLEGLDVELARAASEPA